MQKSNETLRDYIQRLITLHHTVENVSDHQSVRAFKDGVKNRELSLKFGRTGDMTLSRMMEIATIYANSEEEDRLRSGKYKAAANEAGGGNSSRKQKRKAEPAAPSPFAYLVAISIIRLKVISPVRPNFKLSSLFLTPSLKAQTAW